MAKITSVKIYDESGKLVEIDYYSAGVLIEKDLYTTVGKKTYAYEKDYLNPAGIITQKVFLDSSKKITGKEFYSDTGVLTEKDYYTKGVLTEKDYINPEGVITQKDFYRAKGIIEKTYYSGVEITRVDFYSKTTLIEQDLYTDGVLGEKNFYLKGVQTQKNLYSAGVLSEIDLYSKGNLTQKGYYEDDLLVRTELFTKNILTEQDIYTTSGGKTYISEKDYFNSSGDIYQKNYLNSKGIITQKDYYTDDVRTQSDFYTNKVLTAKWFYQNNQIVEIDSCKNNTILQKTFYTDGEITEVDNYKSGKLSTKSYYENDVITQKDYYSKDAVIQSDVYTDGDLTERDFFTKGVLTQKHLFSEDVLTQKDYYVKGKLSEKDYYNPSGVITKKEYYDGNEELIDGTGVVLTDSKGNKYINYGQAKLWGKYLDYKQGDNSLKYKYDCGVVACENVLIQTGDIEKRGKGTVINGLDLTESAVVNYAADNDLCITDFPINIYNGGTTDYQQAAILTELGSIADDVIIALGTLAEYVKDGFGVIAEVISNVLWGKASYGSVDHAVAVTGVNYDFDNPLIIEGFYICDSGRGLSTDSSRYISYDLMKSAFISTTDWAGRPLGYAIITEEKKLVLNSSGTAGNIDVNSIIQQIGGYGSNQEEQLIANAGDDVQQNFQTLVANSVS